MFILCYCNTKSLDKRIVEEEHFNNVEMFSAQLESCPTLMVFQLVSVFGVFFVTSKFIFIFVSVFVIKNKAP